MVEQRAGKASGMRRKPAPLESAGYNGRMNLRVEFFGIARQRAGVARAEIVLSHDEPTLGTALSQLASTFSGLEGECIENGRLRSGFSANLGGERFVSDPATPLCDGDCLLILSADAGG